MNSKIEYGVQDGWIAVSRAANASSATAGTVYVGELDDVELIPANQIPVSMSFYYKDGTIALPAETVMAFQEDGAESFKLEHKIDIPAGYTAIIDDDHKNVYSIDADGKSRQHY